MPSKLSQGLLGLLLETRNKNWPIADWRGPSNDPRNNCGIHFGSRPLLVSKVTNFSFLGLPKPKPMMNLSVAYIQYQGTNELTNATQQTRHEEKKRIFRRPYLSDRIPKMMFPNNQPRNIIEEVRNPSVDLPQTRRHCEKLNTETVLFR